MWELGLPDGAWPPDFIKNGKDLRDIVERDVREPQNVIKGLEQEIKDLKRETERRKKWKRDQDSAEDPSQYSLPDFGLDDPVPKKGIDMQ